MKVTRLPITDFPGLVNNMDQNDLPPGAGPIQVNMQSNVQGELRVRRGYRPVTFANRGLVETTITPPDPE